MIAITAVALVLTDPLLAVVGLVVFPLVFVANVVYSQVMSPRMQRAQQLRAEVSEIAHESFDAALVVKTLGREAVGDRALRRPRRRAARRARRRRPGPRPVRPAHGGAAQPRHARRAARSAPAGSPTAATDAGDLVSIAYLFTLLALPIRAIGWVLADLPRALAGFDRVTPVLDATGETPYGPDAAAPGAGGAGLGVSDVDFTFDGDVPADAARASPST